MTLDTLRLAKLVRIKRGAKPLRETSAEIGNVSPATLSRVEHRSVPDMETFIALCNWLDVHPGDLFLTDKQHSQSSTQELDTVEEITALLISDKNLDPISASILIRIIKAAYYELVE
jgi:transcriptional regulator with XRE-family HTH domain